MVCMTAHLLLKGLKECPPVGEGSNEWVGDELDDGLGGEHEASLHVLLQQLIVLPNPKIFVYLEKGRDQCEGCRIK
jgi:hypothetical protein